MRTQVHRYADRREAGRALGDALQGLKGRDLVVCALPRGGVVVGAEVARALEAPLELVIPRKVGHPFNPEYAVCAVTETGEPVCQPEEVELLPPGWLQAAIARARLEAAARRRLYRGERPPRPLEGKTVVLVDDGVATGLTMLAALREVRQGRPERVVVAVPVAPASTVRRLAEEADEVVALQIPEPFMGAVGYYYRDFSPVDDEEVLELLEASLPR
jgi:predicted phosphoribosyltransferase